LQKAVSGDVEIACKLLTYWGENLFPKFVTGFFGIWRIAKKVVPGIQTAPAGVFGSNERVRLAVVV
jgi:hypothetical protein